MHSHGLDDKGPFPQRQIENLQRLVPRPGDRWCAFGCGAAGVPEPGYRFFACGDCLDKLADLLERMAVDAG